MSGVLEQEQAQFGLERIKILEELMDKMMNYDKGMKMQTGEPAMEKLLKITQKSSLP